MGAHSAPTAQPDATPTAKVSTNLLVGLAAADIMAIAHNYGVEIGPGVAGLVVAGLGFVAAYMKKSRPGDRDL